MLLVVSLVSITSHAAEVIHSFHSEIVIQASGDLLVTETINVRAEGVDIKRGIYRDFPTTYTDNKGNIKKVGFDLLSIKRDGENEAYHLKDRSNGIRIYIGQSDWILSPGQYRYSISYLTSRQLGYFDSFDELYWNVTGTGWAFPISQASATVTLPDSNILDSFADIQLNAYTGAQGSTQTNYTANQTSNNTVTFETTKPLQSRQGLTIVIGWPKGVVSQPTSAEMRKYFVQDNLHSVIAVGGLCLLFIYYYLIWRRVGRDPKTGIIIPRYQAPAGYSPASMRYVSNMGYDNKCFTAAIINLACKAALVIDNSSASRFSIEKQDVAGSSLAAGESALLNALFSKTDTVTVDKKEHRLLAKSKAAHHKSLKTDYEKKYFVTNHKYLTPGILITITTAYGIFINIPSERVLESTIIFSMFTFVPLIIFAVSIKGLKQKRRGSKIQLLINAVIVVIIISFLSNSTFVSENLIGNTAWAVSICLVLMLLMNYGFHQLLKAPTLAGRKLLDKTQGFKHYLSVAEDDEIAFKDQPAFTTDLYEQYLPYAIALNIENTWTDKLNQAILSGLVDPHYRQPRWYRSHSQQGHFSNELSTQFDSAIRLIVCRTRLFFRFVRRLVWWWRRRRRRLVACRILLFGRLQNHKFLIAGYHFAVTKYLFHLGVIPQVAITHNIELSAFS